jgi:hypothetical protein
MGREAWAIACKAESSGFGCGYIRGPNMLEWPPKVRVTKAHKESTAEWTRDHLHYTAP